MNNIKIYDNIRLEAKRAGISINSLEKAANLSAGSLCKWNTVSPTVRNLKSVANVLSVSIELLLEPESVNNKKKEDL